MIKFLKRINYINTFFYMLFVFFILYSSYFIYQTSFKIGETRFFCLFDDAMISMKYAKNFANGMGLVWNAGGERVEGITNLLWTISMSFFHLLPVSISKISLVIQLSALLCLLVSLILYVKIVYLVSKQRVLVVLGALFLTMFYYPSINWSLQGMEVGVLFLVLNAALVLILSARENNVFSFTGYIILGVGSLFRIDMFIPFITIAIYMFLTDKKHRKKHLFYSLTVFLIFFSGQTLFRFIYYGEFFPNTYYLKVTGIPLWLRIQRGMAIAYDFLLNIKYIVLVVIFGLIIHRKNRFFSLFIFLFVMQILYSIYVGADVWERGGANRFICIVMPYFILCFVFFLYFFLECLFSKKKTLITVYSILLVVSLISLNSFNQDVWKEFLFRKKPYETVLNKHYLEVALLVKMIALPQATIGVSRAGILPYFSERNAVDFLGKSDKFIARQHMQLSPDNLSVRDRFLPGHVKWDYSYSIGELKPDIIPHYWVFWNGGKEASKILKNGYSKIVWNNSNYYLYLKNDSPFIKWNSDIIKSGKIET